MINELQMALHLKIDTFLTPSCRPLPQHGIKDVIDINYSSADIIQIPKCLNYVGT